MLSLISSVMSSASITDWILLTSTFILTLYIWGTWRYDYFKPRGIYFIRPKLPFFGNMTSALFGMSSMSEMMKKLYEEGKGNGVVGLFEFSKPVFMVRDPELLKIITVKDFDSFVNHRTMDEQSIEPQFTQNLINLKDERWRDVRTTLSPAFTTSKIKGMFPLISQVAQQMVDHLIAIYCNSKEGKKNIPMETNIKDIFSHFANDVIATTAFGVRCNSLKESDNEFYKMGRALTNFSAIRTLIIVGFLAVPKLMAKFGARLLEPKAVDFFESLIQETIREREKKGIVRPDMLQLLMQARKGELKAEAGDVGEEENISARKKKLDDNDVTAQAIIFFFAGFESVSSTLGLVSYALSFNQEVQRRLQNEIDEMMEAANGQPTYEALQGMKYMDMVINETLRLFPTAPNSDRECSADTMLPSTATTLPIKVPKKSIINIPIIGLHHDPHYWTDPMTFDPERFNDENKQKIKPFTYMPFGVGPRLCIGQRFALMEMKLAMVHLLAKFDLYSSPKLKYPMEYQKGFNISPKGGFLCGIKPRISSKSF